MNDKSATDTLGSDLIKTIMKDRKSSRRWKNLRFLGWALMLLMYAVLIFGPPHSSSDSNSKKPYISLVRLNGIIMPGKRFSAHQVLPQLNRAFKDKKSKGVILLINSPGGSPVQASIIHDKIEQLKQKYHKKIIVMGEDSLASGAYLIATAADKIYVNKDTLTGSIGVIMNSFGFTDAIKKLGITRRVFTAGTNKDRLDPFKPISSADKEKLHSVLNAVHQNFIDDVQAGRKGRLTGDPKELFSGDFWTGQQAVKLGLVDGTSNLWTVMKDQFDVTHYKDYSARPSVIEILTKGMSSTLHLALLNQSTPIQTIASYR